jgi:hypothetical protein
MAPSNNGPRNLTTSQGRLEARAEKLRKDPKLMGMIANYIVYNNPNVGYADIHKYIRNIWVGPNKPLVPFRRDKLNEKIFTAFYKANGQKLVNERKKKIQNKKNANVKARWIAQAKKNANEKARVNKLKQTNEGRMRLARENARARESALQNNLRHGGHFAAGY